MPRHAKACQKPQHKLQSKQKGRFSLSKHSKGLQCLKNLFKIVCNNWQDLRNSSLFLIKVVRRMWNSWTTPILSGLWLMPSGITPWPRYSVFRVSPKPPGNGKGSSRWENSTMISIKSILGQYFWRKSQPKTTSWVWCLITKGSKGNSKIQPHFTKNA